MLLLHEMSSCSFAVKIECMTAVCCKFTLLRLQNQILVLYKLFLSNVSLLNKSNKIQGLFRQNFVALSRIVGRIRCALPNIPCSTTRQIHLRRFTELRIRRWVRKSNAPFFGITCPACTCGPHCAKSLEGEAPCGGAVYGKVDEMSSASLPTPPTRPPSPCQTPPLVEKTMRIRKNR